MIKIDSHPIISRIQIHRTCSTLIIYNYTKLPNDIYTAIMKNSFIASTYNTRDIICVLPNSWELDSIWAKLVGVSNFCKVESVRL